MGRLLTRAVVVPRLCVPVVSRLASPWEQTPEADARRLPKRSRDAAKPAVEPDLGDPPSARYSRWRLARWRSGFYAVATGVGGIIGPALYGHNIAAGNRTTVFYGYLLGAALMILGGLSEIWLGVRADQRQLEDVAKPLTADR